MRAAARRILDQFAPATDRRPAPALDDAAIQKINALESPHEGESLPDTWTPTHVAKRLIEAFETAAKLPPDRGPRAPGNHWPQHIYDWSDQLSEASLPLAEQMDRQRARNRVRERPSAQELRRMEMVFEWLRDLHAVDDGLCRVVQRWARLRASRPRRSVKEWCRRTGLSFQVFYRRRDKGLAVMAAKITTPVW